MIAICRMADTPGASLGGDFNQFAAMGNKGGAGPFAIALTVQKSLPGLTVLQGYCGNRTG